MQETWVQSLGHEDPLEEELATYSRRFSLENPTDRGAWWATVHGVPKSWTRLSDWITTNKTNSVCMSTPNSHKVIFKNCNSDPYTLCLKSPVISHQARKKSDFFLNSYVMCPDYPVLIFLPIPFFPHLFFTVCL